MAINPETGLEEVVHGLPNRGFGGIFDQMDQDKFQGLLNTFIQGGGPWAMLNGSWGGPMAGSALGSPVLDVPGSGFDTAAGVGVPTPTTGDPAAAGMPAFGSAGINPVNGLPYPTDLPFPKGSAGIDAPWTMGREPYAAQGSERAPYDFDKSYWDQRAQMSAGFRGALRRMPGVFDPTFDATTGYPFFQPMTRAHNLSTMMSGGAGGAGLLGMLTGGAPGGDIMAILKNLGIDASALGGGDTLTGLPRPPPGLRSVPGVHEPGVWQQRNGEWVWTANDQFGRPILNESPITAPLAAPTQGPAAAGAGFGSGGMGPTGGLPQWLIDLLFPGPPPTSGVGDTPVEGGR